MRTERTFGIAAWLPLAVENHGIALNKIMGSFLVSEGPEGVRQDEGDAPRN